MNQAKQSKSSLSETSDNKTAKIPPNKVYTIAREGSGYSVFDGTGAKRSEENVLVLTYESLKRLINSDMKE